MTLNVNVVRVCVPRQRSVGRCAGGVEKVRDRNVLLAAIIAASFSSDLS
jgi:hypothetical protein